MNIFLIHSGDNKEGIQDVKAEILQKCGPKAHVLLLEYRNPFWKREAISYMKAAHMILYVVSKDTHHRKNVDWELCQAVKLGKNITTYNVNGFPLNNTLIVRDPFTQEEITLGDEIHSIDELATIVSDFSNKKDVISTLFRNPDADVLTPEESNQLMEQYKLFTQTSEELVSRRQNVNSFYITANTALITVVATVFALTGDVQTQYIIIAIILTIPGILLNVSWRQILEAYGITNSSKLAVIGLLEKRLQASIYDAEWVAMSNKYNLKKYVSFTESEKRIPQIFILLYIFVDIIAAIGIAYITFFIK